MSPKKRQKKNTKSTTITNNHNLEINHHVLPILEDTCITQSNGFEQDNSIIQDQDEEYELSVIMDIIKMQEKEDNERLEKEKQEKIEKERLLTLSIEKRDHNIKEILRKLKILVNTNSSFEKKLVDLLENTMNTKELQILICDNDFYINIQRYLGLNNTKGIIRLTDDIKQYINNMFICETDLPK